MITRFPLVLGRAGLGAICLIGTVVLQDTAAILDPFVLLPEPEEPVRVIALPENVRTECCEELQRYIRGVGVFDHEESHPEFVGWTLPHFRHSPFQYERRFLSFPGGRICVHPTDVKVRFTSRPEVFRIDWQPTLKANAECEGEVARWHRDIERHEGYHVADVKSIVRTANSRWKRTQLNHLMACDSDPRVAVAQLEKKILSELKKKVVYMEGVAREFGELIDSLRSIPQLDCSKCVQQDSFLEFRIQQRDVDTRNHGSVLVETQAIVPLEIMDRGRFRGQGEANIVHTWGCGGRFAEEDARIEVEGEYTADQKLILHRISVWYGPYTGWVGCDSPAQPVVRNIGPTGEAFFEGGAEFSDLLEEQAIMSFNDGTMITLPKPPYFSEYPASWSWSASVQLTTEPCKASDSDLTCLPRPRVPELARSKNQVVAPHG